MTLPNLIMYNSVIYVMENKSIKTSSMKMKRKDQLAVKQCKTQKEQKYVANFGVKIYNKLPLQNKTKTKIKEYFLLIFIALNEFFDDM